MNVLVTGSSGLIGRELTKQLLCKGNIVYGVDISQSVIKHKNYIHSYSILDEKYDKIFHLMGYPCPADYLNNPMTTIFKTIEAFKNVSLYAKKSQADFIVASSSEVYADENFDHDMKENSLGVIPLEHPRACYKELKRILEVLTHSYKRETKNNAKIIRVFNSYGKYHKYDTRFIPQLINCAKTNSVFTIYGNGEQKRSYCHVSDTVKGILLYSDSNMSCPVNIGNPYEEYSVNEVIKIFEEVIGFTIKTKHENNIDMIGPAYRRPDITLIKSLGWEPKVNLKEGSKKILL